MALAAALAAAILVPAPAGSKDYQQAARGVTVPVGFAATVFAATPMVPTTLTWGPAPPEAGFRHDHGELLYVGGVAGNPLSCDGCGQVIAYPDEGAVPTIVAQGFNSVLGIAFGPDGTLYVSDNLNNAGRVTANKDLDQDGIFEQRRVLLKNIPNGRHQTNGLSIGPDDMLYVANGNATDDGIECGPPLPPDNSVECATDEVDPWTGSIIRVNPAWNDVDLLKDIRVDVDPFYAADGMDDESVLIAEGFRNIYDVDFRPGAPNEIWTPMNGPDDPAGSEAIYGLAIDNEQIVGYDPETNEPIYGPVIEDAGFPSCLYDPHPNPFPAPNFGHEHPGNPAPQNTTNQAVLDKFGDCPLETVLIPRAVLREGHEGTSGLAFERGNKFPAHYDGDLFVAEWGSLWNLNGASVTGHKIEVLDVAADGSVSGRQREFMTTPLPIDLTFGPDGLLYVADMTGQIYKVEHVTATPEVFFVDMINPCAAASVPCPQFVPPVATVTRGTTVRWCNSDTVPHNIRGVKSIPLTDPTLGERPPQPGNEIDSPGNIPPGGCYSYMFGNRAGVWLYQSSALAEGNTMQGTVVVLPVER